MRYIEVLTRTIDLVLRRSLLASVDGNPGLY